MKPIDMQAGDEAERGAAGRAPARAWYALAVLIGTTLFAFVDRQIINLVAPSFQTMLGLTDFQLGALQGLGMALFASIAGYPIGWLADRFGRRLILGICIVVWSVSTAACASQYSYSGLFAASAGIAIGEAALGPIIFSMLPDLFPERQRNTANFIFFAAILLGAAAGLTLGGITLNWLGQNQQMLPGFLATIDNWRAALILVAIPAPLFLLLLGTIRMTRRVDHRAAAGDPVATDRSRILPFLRAHWLTLTCIYGTTAAYSLPLNSSFTWLPIALPRIFGTAASAIGVHLGITVAVASIVGLSLSPLGLRLLRHRDALLNPFRLGRTFILIAVAPTLMLPFATAAWQVYVICGMQLSFALGTGALMPGLLQQTSTPQLRARLMAIQGVVMAVTAGAAPTLVGGISGLVGGQRSILIAMAIVSVPGWILAAFLLTVSRRPFLVTAAAVKAAGEERRGEAMGAVAAPTQI